MNFLKKYTENGMYTAYFRAVAIDFSLSKLYFYDPKSVAIIQEYSGKPLEQMMEDHPDIQDELQYCMYDLIENNILFISEQNDVFPEVNTSELSYTLLDNMHIICSTSTIRQMSKLLLWIDTCKIKAAKLDFKKCRKDEIKFILKKLTHTNLESIECIFDFVNNGIDKEFLDEISKINDAITYFKFSNITRGFSYNHYFINVLREDTQYPKFSTSFRLYNESQHFNTYFHKKLYITEEGEIKNAIETPDHFGNLDDYQESTQIRNLVKSAEFQKYWNIKKDKIDVCKDCEFRHVCVDNRVPKQRTDGSYYQTTECKFNPYLSKWNTEHDYKTLSEIGVIVNEHKYERNDDTIYTLNKKIWGH